MSIKSICIKAVSLIKSSPEVVPTLIAKKVKAEVPFHQTVIGRYMGRYFTTVTLGQYYRRYNHCDFRFMREMLVRSGYKDRDEGLVEIRPEMISEEETVDVYTLTGKELGLRLFASRTEFFYRASQYGFCLCPPEIGPLVLMKKQDRNYYQIAMCPEKTWTYDPNQPSRQRIDLSIFYLEFNEAENKQCIGTIPAPDIAHSATWLFIRHRGQVVFEGMTCVQISSAKE